MSSAADSHADPLALCGAIEKEHTETGDGYNIQRRVCAECRFPWPCDAIQAATALRRLVGERELAEKQWREAMDYVSHRKGVRISYDDGTFKNLTARILSLEEVVRQETLESVRAEHEALRGALGQCRTVLTVEAAEYVPAIGDAMTIIANALNERTINEAAAPNDAARAGEANDHG